MKNLSVVLVAVTLCSTGMAQTAATDISAVQQAYAKAAYALQITAVYDLYPVGKDYALGKQVSPAEVQAAVAASTLTFEISNIKTGLIGEIANTGILEMVGNPLHATLRIYSSSQNYSKNCDAVSAKAGLACVRGEQLLIHARWEPAPDTPAGAIPDVPVMTALKEDRLNTD